MKKLLIASTALVATSGYAAAQVELGGSAQFGVIYQEDRQLTDGYGVAQDNELYLDYELQFDFSGSTTTDSGLTFGASAEFENDSDAFADSKDQGFDPEIFVSGGFGTLTVGDIDVATDSAFGGLTRDPGYDGIGIDNKIDSLVFADAGAGFDIDEFEIDSNIQYEFAASGFEFTLTTDSFEQNYGIAAAYDTGTFRVGLGYVDIADYNENTFEAPAGAPDNGGKSISLFLGGEFAGFDLDFVYATHENDAAGGDIDGYGLSGGYDLGGYTLTFAAYYIDPDDTVAANLGTGDDGWDYGIGVAYDLGGGAELQAGLGQTWNPGTDEDVLRASLGMAFKF